jgi:superfamily I DNA and/or RNA helicase
VREKSKTQFKIATLKSNCALFSRLYVSCLSRESNLDDFCGHENQAYSPSLTRMGEIRSTKKSDLVDCLLEDQA